MTARRFELHRDSDITGVSGTGVVAEGIAFTDGTVALRWRSEWPTSVVFHDRGVEAVRKVHGHGGSTRLVWLDVAGGPPAVDWGGMWTELGGYVGEAVTSPGQDDAAQIALFMVDLKKRYFRPVTEWMAAISKPAVSTSSADN